MLEKCFSAEDLIQTITAYLTAEYEQKETVLTDTTVMRRVERSVYLSVFDALWMEHIDNMQSLRESVSLRGYGQRDPLIEYKEQAFLMFTRLLNDSATNTLNTLFKIDLKKELPENLLKTPEQPKNIITNEQDIDNSLTHASYSTIDAAMGEDINSPVTATNPVRIKAENGPVNNTPTAGRNDPCPCGSGKKYKKCHGANLI